jgi:hypothetical protein
MWACGTKNDTLELYGPERIYPLCGMTNPRDPNAARNIEVETLRI